jgi:hypothetical protein
MYDISIPFLFFKVSHTLKKKSIIFSIFTKKKSKRKNYPKLLVKQKEKLKSIFM